MSSNNVKSNAHGNQPSKQNNLHKPPTGKEGMPLQPSHKGCINNTVFPNLDKPSIATQPHSTLPDTAHPTIKPINNPAINPTKRTTARRYTKKKVRLTAVEAAFKALEQPRTLRKKVLSRIYPPLFEDENNYVVLEKKELEQAKQDVEPGEERVMMWDPTRNRKVAGVAAPKRKNIHQYLMKKPYMHMYYGQDFLAKRDAM